MLPICFYVCYDTTCLQNLLSYARSERLGIIEFKIHNKASTSAIEPLQLSTNWHLNTYHSAHPYTQTTQSARAQQIDMPKPALKKATSQKLTSSQDHHMSMPTTADVHDIVALKKAFPASFDTNRICQTPTP